uniref:DUF148 domain-containing protein n=1 Tax=Parastrongyloides trichosuri TaxID=131310 RepID=A0A0N4ZNI5_PARTI
MECIIILLLLNISLSIAFLDHGFGSNYDKYYYNIGFFKNYRNIEEVKRIYIISKSLNISKEELTSLHDKFYNFYLIPLTTEINDLIRRQSINIKNEMTEVWNKYKPPSRLLDSLNNITNEEREHFSKLMKNDVWSIMDIIIRGKIYSLPKENDMEDGFKFWSVTKYLLDKWLGKGRYEGWMRW